MKNIKKTKILVPALALTMLTTVASVTSTVAWFVSNNTATATGMHMSATTNSAFLLIADKADGFDEKNGTHDLKFTDPTPTELLPSAIDSKDYASYLAKDAMITKFYTMIGTSFTDGAGNGDKTYLTTGNYQNYVIYQDAFLKLADKSPNQDVPLTITGSTFSDNFAGKAAKMLVVPYASTLVDNESVTVSAPFIMDSTNHTNHFILADKLPAGYVLGVDFYFFYDGNNSSITSSNYTSTSGGSKWNASCDFEFNLNKDESAKYASAISSTSTNSSEAETSSSAGN